MPSHSNSVGTCSSVLSERLKVDEALDSNTARRKSDSDCQGFSSEGQEVEEFGRLSVPGASDTLPQRRSSIRRRTARLPISPISPRSPSRQPAHPRRGSTGSMAPRRGSTGASKSLFATPCESSSSSTRRSAAWNKDAMQVECRRAIFRESRAALQGNSQWRTDAGPAHRFRCVANAVLAATHYVNVTSRVVDAFRSALSDRRAREMKDSYSLADPLANFDRQVSEEHKITEKDTEQKALVKVLTRFELLATAIKARDPDAVAGVVSSVEGLIRNHVTRLHELHISQARTQETWDGLGQDFAAQVSIARDLSAKMEADLPRLRKLLAALDGGTIDEIADLEQDSSSKSRPEALVPIVEHCLTYLGVLEKAMTKAVDNEEGMSEDSFRKELFDILHDGNYERLIDWKEDVTSLVRSNHTGIVPVNMPLQLPSAMPHEESDSISDGSGLDDLGESPCDDVSKAYARDVKYKAESLEALQFNHSSHDSIVREGDDEERQVYNSKSIAASTREELGSGRISVSRAVEGVDATREFRKDALANEDRCESTHHSEVAVAKNTRGQVPEERYGDEAVSGSMVVPPETLMRNEIIHHSSEASISQESAHQVNRRPDGSKAFHKHRQYRIAPRHTTHQEMMAITMETLNQSERDLLANILSEDGAGEYAVDRVSKFDKSPQEQDSIALRPQPRRTQVFTDVDTYARRLCPWAMQSSRDEALTRAHSARQSSHDGTQARAPSARLSSHDTLARSPSARQSLHDGARAPSAKQASYSGALPRAQSALTSIDAAAPCPDAEKRMRLPPKVLSNECNRYASAGHGGCHLGTLVGRLQRSCIDFAP